MKSVNFYLPLFILLLFILGCSEEDTPGSEPSQTSGIVLEEGNLYSFFATDTQGSFSFTTNQEWSISPGASWLVLSPLTGSAGKSALTLTLEQNEEPEERETTFTIVSGTAKQQITVVQKGKDALILSPEVREVGPRGGSLEVEVKANIDFEIIIEEEFQDWITYVDTRSLTSYNLIFEIAPNPLFDNREGQIIIKDKNSGLSDIIRVYQTYKDGFIVSQRNHIISDEGEVFQVQVTSNVEYEVIMPQVAWVNLIESRAVSTRTLTIDVAINSEYEKRETEIIFRDRNSSLSDTVFIYQVQKDAILLTKERYDVGNSGSELQIEVKSNIDFDVQIEDNWIQKIETRSLKTHLLKFAIAESRELDTREGRITFSNRNKPGHTETIIIAQKGINETLQKEREVLITLYEKMNGKQWKNAENWCTDKPLEEWFGITVENGRVIGLDLTNNNLQGNIIPELGQLEKLQSLSLSYNRLSGNIPPEIGNLTSLTELRLYTTEFLSGPIPAEMGSLVNLEVLILEYNQLSGPIPTELGNLKKVWALMLSNNNLEGNIPVEIADLTYLRQFTLNNNCMSGEIPKAIVESIWFNIWEPEINIYPQQPGYGLSAPARETHPLDGIVYEYLKSSKPQEVSLIFMGDGFLAEHMGKGGKYYSVLAEAADVLMDVEPFKTYRDYFSIYFVNAVSKEEGASTPEKKVNTVFSSVVNFTNSAAISCNQELCYEYAEKVGLTGDNGAILLVLNTDKFGGSSGGRWREGGFAAVTYDYGYVNTVAHEMGHAFAFLADEYYTIGGTDFFPESEYATQDARHEMGMDLNVDYKNDPETVIWKHFIGHPKYPMVGIYEGAYWPKGRYRPEETSCMIDNRLYYNAPSREAIVKRIKSLAGETYSFDEFVEKDVIEYRER